jgi:hypothetical protein
MRQRLRFGDKLSLARVAVGRTFELEVPKFGPHCVCCNADAQGRVQNYDASTDRRSVDPVPMPVCCACKDHALIKPFAPMMQAVLVILGGSLTTLGAMYAADLLADPFLTLMMVAGVLLVVLSVAWIRSSSARVAGNGHYPRFEFSVVTGAPLVDTDNETLVEELLALNPRAHRLPTPLLWRLRGDGLPKARLVKRD